MGIAEWVAVTSVLIALVSLIVQQHLNRQQSRSEATARHHDRTQTLLLRALDDPVLLEAISGKCEKDQKHRRYRQLWFNHVEVIFRQRYLFDNPHWQGTINDIRDFMNMSAMRQHWLDHQHFYAGDFQAFMNQEIFTKRAEPPTVEAPPTPTQASTT